MQPARPAPAMTMGGEAAEAWEEDDIIDRRPTIASRAEQEACSGRDRTKWKRKFDRLKCSCVRKTLQNRRDEVFNTSIVAF
jgi:hypothetical protein